jgi:hypothetical protein
MAKRARLCKHLLVSQQVVNPFFPFCKLSKFRTLGANLQTLHGKTSAQVYADPSANLSSNQNSHSVQNQSNFHSAQHQASPPIFQTVTNPENIGALPDIYLFGTLVKPQFALLALAVIYFFGTQGCLLLLLMFFLHRQQQNQPAPAVNGPGGPPRPPLQRGSGGAQAPGSGAMSKGNAPR